MSNGLLDNMAVTPRMWWLDVACSNHLMLAVELYENLPSARQKVRATHSSTHPWPAHVHALTDAFTHRGFYTQKILHTEAFTRRGFYTQKLLHAEAFTHRRFYTQKLLHRRFLQRRFYTQKLLHTDAFTHRSFYTEHTEAFKQTLLHRRFYTQTLLHRDAFTHRRFYTETLLHHRGFYTQMLLHTEALTHSTQKLCTHRKNRNFTSVFGLISCERVATGTRKSQFYLSFWRSNLISCERVARDDLNSHFLPQFSAIEPHFVRKGCAGQVANRNFTSVFDDRTSFHAKRLRGTSWNRNFTSVFDDWTSFRAKGLRGTSWNRNFTSLLTIEPRFVRKGCVSCRLVGTAPAPAFRREIEKKERARKRARGQEEKMWRCEDVKMWRSEDVKMRRWDTDPHYWKNPALRRSREQTHASCQVITSLTHGMSPLPACNAWVPQMTMNETASFELFLESFTMRNPSPALSNYLKATLSHSQLHASLSGQLPSKK